MKKLLLTASVCAVLLPGANAFAQQDFRQYTNQELFQNLNQYSQNMDREELMAYRAEMQYRARRMNQREMQALGLQVDSQGRLQDRERAELQNTQQLQKQDTSGLQDQDRDRVRDEDCATDGSGSAKGGNAGDGNGGGSGGGDGGGNGGGNGGGGNGGGGGGGGRG
jgi:hypothetical protein